MTDSDLGLHPSEQAPLGYRVQRVGNRYYPMRYCSDGVWCGWNRYDAYGVPIGARTFATARAAARFCWQRHSDQP